MGDTLTETTVLFKKNNPEAVIPSRGSRASAGLDLTILETRVMQPGEFYLFDLGLSMFMPYGWVGIVRPRSSIFKKGLDINGVIDSDYRGPLKLMVRNSSKGEVTVTKGERLAQLIVMLHYSGPALEVTELDETERGSGGFGSTGK